MNPVINIAIYQIIWFACILYGNNGAIFCLVLLIVHLLFSNQRKADLKMMGILLIIGSMVDGTLNGIGFFIFKSNNYPIPYWLATIWLALATLPHHSLNWLKKRLVLASLFGTLSGPLAYWAGVKMGAAAFNWTLPSSLISLAIIWALLCPAIMYIAEKNKHD
jgi:hypothetical protein